MAKGVSEDRTGLHICLSAGGSEVPRDCLLAAMDDRVGWRRRAMGRGVDCG